MRVLFLVFAVLVAMPAAARGSEPASAAQLKQRLAKIVASLGSGKVGVYIKVLKTGRVVFNDNGATPMIPASNLKVVTTSVALDRLGPNFRYTTELVGPPASGNGVIHGDVYLKGAGDPTWCYPYTEPTGPLKFFAKQLKDQGVKEIAGDLVGDDSAFDREYIGQGWFDRYLMDSYAAPVSALSLNTNLCEVTVTSKGITLNPPSPALPILNKVTPGSSSDIWITRERGDERTVINGHISPGGVVKQTITVGSPSLFTVGCLGDALKKAGITIRGKMRLIERSGEAARVTRLKVYARYQSPKLSEIIAQVNKESDNVFAQHVFKTLGERFQGYGTAATGEAAVKFFMEHHGIDSAGLRMVDGSGLSTLNRISPRQLVGIIEAMWRHHRGQDFVDSLPGDGEGTLTYRLSGLTVRAKTGTLDGHSGLSGYVVSAYGQTIGFSILVNNVSATWSAVDLEDRIVRTLATWEAPL